MDAEKEAGWDVPGRADNARGRGKSAWIMEGKLVIDREKKRVLLIDDDTSLLVTLGDFLKFEGYDVTTAESGEAGLAKLESMSPNLIILDMSMPGMGGVGFLKAISSADGQPRYPVLVLTARANMAEFFANVDVDGFVAKPCDPRDLLMEVSRIIFLRSEHGPVSGGSLQGKRVLIGEDEDALREALVKRFGEAGFAASSVSKGAEVIERAVLDKPDAVVMKLIFQNMNGDTIAAVLRDMPATRGVPVVLYDDSGSGASAATYRVSNHAMRRFVSSSDPGDLLDAVRDVLGGG